MELPEVGTVFNSKYRLDEILGAGGFATVFRATDIAAERTVAIKVLTPDDNGYSRATTSRFEREVQVVAQLRDPHTVTMFDFGTTPEGLLFMVFEFVPGEDLSELIARHGRLEPPVVIHILVQVLQSLREAHAYGLLHRDIKPANIRIYEYMGDPYRVKVLDFGIARAVAPDQLAQITAKGELVGTPRYMSPEQLFGGELTTSTDVYSVGVVAFEMLMGSDAMHGTRLSDQLARLQTGHMFSVPELNRIGPALSQTLDRMCAREATTRFRTADQALEALRALESSGGLAPAPAGSAATLSGPLFAPNTGPQPVPRTPATPMQPIRVDSAEYDRRVPVPGAYTTGRTESLAAPPKKPILAAAIAIVLVVTTIALAFVAYRLAQSADEPPAPPPVVATRPVPAIVANDEPSAPMKEPDAGAPIDPARESPGCRKPPPFAGAGDLRVISGLSQTNWPAYIPTSYDPSRPQALVIMLHENAEGPRQFIAYSRLPKLAEEHGFVIVAPHDDKTPTDAWAEPSDVFIVKEALQDAAEMLCIDPQRIFAVSHGAAGKMVERMPCEMPQIRAIAAASYRTETGREHDACVPEKPIPYLQLSPLKDGYNPVRGGQGCSGVSKLSLADHEKRWREINHCQGSRREVHVEGRNICYSWGCEADLVTCHLAGGRGWKGTQARTFDIHGCDGTPPDFDSAKMIWDFFSRVAPAVDEAP